MANVDDDPFGFLAEVSSPPRIPSVPSPPQSFTSQAPSSRKQSAERFGGAGQGPTQKLRLSNKGSFSLFAFYLS